MLLETPNVVILNQIEQYLSKYIQQVCLSWKSCVRFGDTIQSRGGWKFENFGTPGQPLLNEVMLFFSCCHLVGFNVMNGLAVSLSVPNYHLVWTGVWIDRRMRKMCNFPNNWRHTKSRLLPAQEFHRFSNFNFLEVLEWFVLEFYNCKVFCKLTCSLVFPTVLFCFFFFFCLYHCSFFCYI
jgi:hypothetical protein